MTDALSPEVMKLAREIAQQMGYHGRKHDADIIARALAAERASCQARVAELERRLKPFAKYADDEWTEYHGDDTPILDHEGEFICKLGDFRAARSALEGK